MVGPERITSFAELPWGSPADKVRARWGDPVAEEPVTNAVELAYHQTVNGQQVEAEFTIHQNHGLIVGCYVVPFDGPENCSAMFTQWRDAISQAYPGIDCREEQEVEQDGMAFDQAFALGAASWCVEWDDPSGLSRIELLVWPSAEVFWVSYYGPHADAWEEERFRAERPQSG